MAKVGDKFDTLEEYLNMDSSTIQELCEALEVVSWRSDGHINPDLKALIDKELEDQLKQYQEDHIVETVTIKTPDREVIEMNYRHYYKDGKLL